MWPGDHRVGVRPVQSDGVPIPALGIKKQKLSMCSPERSQVGSFHPRGELCSSKGSSDHGYRQVKTSFHEKKMQVFQEEESPQMVYEASEGGVETSSDKQKSQAIDILSFIVFVLFGNQYFLIFYNLTMVVMVVM